MGMTSSLVHSHGVGSCVPGDSLTLDSSSARERAVNPKS